ncbi:YHS domain-containing protein [Acinetobacter baumannii]|nr:hypothetical protein [Acinetobacter baumannii]MCG6572614.1 YHS domain-containing protein [Acinetobacter baumannii]
MNHHHHEEKAGNNALTDPVCDMAVTDTSKFFEKIENKTFYFCSEKCHSKFKSDPDFSLYTTNFTEPLSYQGSAFLKLPKFP